MSSSIILIFIKIRESEINHPLVAELNIENSLHPIDF